MFDESVQAQLKSAFEKLSSPIVLLVQPSSHHDQEELLGLLAAVASQSEKISVRIAEGDQVEVPTFEILRESNPTGISFRGIPGGHEFTSLILAILNADHKGKQPDSVILNRIMRLNGPAHFKTYVSLSCENCPEVVQALNLISSMRPDFSHEMIDGQYVQSEIEALGIQGVPSIVFENKLLNSGKIIFSDLLRKLEETLGSQTASTQPKNLGHFDVAVIGGGPAGVTAAIYSARKGLKTVLIADRIGGQVQETKGIENMISVPYTEGPHLAAQLGEHLSKYPIQVLEHRRVSQILKDPSQKMSLDTGETLSADSTIIATGAKWRELGIPGEKEHIGSGVAFCAHCDGPFYKDKIVAVVGGGNSGVEAAIDLAGIAKHVTLLEFGSQLKADQVLIEKLKNLPNTAIVLNAKSERIIGDGKKVVGLEYTDRVSQQKTTLNLDGIFVQIGLLPNSQCVKDLVDITPHGEIIVDARGRTSASGIYAAGDVTTIPFKQIVTALGDGAKVALTAFEDRMRKNQSASGANSKSALH